MVTYQKNAAANATPPTQACSRRISGGGSFGACFSIAFIYLGLKKKRLPKHAQNPPMKSGRNIKP